jgi:hypothetical protein
MMLRKCPGAQAADWLGGTSTGTAPVNPAEFRRSDLKISRKESRNSVF